MTNTNTFMTNRKLFNKNYPKKSRLIPSEEYEALKNSDIGKAYDAGADAALQASIQGINEITAKKDAEINY
jgi:hypothetical protein